MKPFRYSNQSAFTLLEVLAASVISSFVAGGTMLAFVTAARITMTQDHAVISEANSFAAQSLEKWRNRVAADDNSLPNEAATMPDANAWVFDGFDASPPGGTESIRNLGAGAVRCTRVRNACGGNCYQVEAQVCWNTIDPLVCNCMQPKCPSCPL